MSAPVHHHGPFPIQRAFVVQFAADTVLGDTGMAGRVEHIVSGQAIRFHAIEELLTFITQILRTPTAPENT